LAVENRRPLSGGQIATDHRIISIGIADLVLPVQADSPSASDRKSVLVTVIGHPQLVDLSGRITMIQRADHWLRFGRPLMQCDAGFPIIAVFGPPSHCE
jgi:hypothetical protein